MVAKFNYDDSGKESGNLSGRLKNFGKSSFSGLKALIGSTIGLGAVGLLAVVGYNTCTTYVKSNEFAVMQVDMSLGGLLGKQGMHEEKYDTGTHIQIPTFQKLHRFPKDLQVLTLKSQNTSTENSRYIKYSNPAHIQTSDGFFIDLDVSIIYRIKDPFKVITTIGAGKLYEDNGIIPQVEPILKETMGKLKPEDFYNSKQRELKQTEAKNAFNELLESKGLYVEHVLTRFPNFHKEVQAKIEGRNLQEQTKYMNIAKAGEAAVESELKKIVQEGKSLVDIKLMKGTNYMTRKSAEMQAYEKIKKSE